MADLGKTDQAVAETKKLFDGKSDLNPKAFFHLGPMLL